jgi:hypothetical protein
MKQHFTEPISSSDIFREVADALTFYRESVKRHFFLPYTSQDLYGLDSVDAKTNQLIRQTQERGFSRRKTILFSNEESHYDFSICTGLALPQCKLSKTGKLD